MKRHRINEQMNTKRNFTHCCSNWTMNIFNRNFDRFYSDLFLSVGLLLKLALFSFIRKSNEKMKRKNAIELLFSFSFSFSSIWMSMDLIRFNSILAKADDDLTICMCVVIIIEEQLSFFFLYTMHYYYDDEQKIMIANDETDFTS